MISWVKNSYKKLFTFLLICNILLNAIAGSVVGAVVEEISGSEVSLGFIGFLIGLIIGIFINITVFGLMATILSMAETQEKILKKMEDGKNSINTFNTDDENNKSNSIVSNRYEPKGNESSYTVPRPDDEKNDYLKYLFDHPNAFFGLFIVAVALIAIIVALILW